MPVMVGISTKECSKEAGAHSVNWDGNRGAIEIMEIATPKHLNALKAVQKVAPLVGRSQPNTRQRTKLMNLEFTKGWIHSSQLSQAGPYVVDCGGKHGKYVWIELPGKDRSINVATVEVEKARCLKK